MPWSTTLAHIYLDPTLPFRNRIINGIVERSKTFDGVQIDFESISAKDGTAYLNFLGAVKNALPADKVFSVAVLPRWASHKKAHPNDAFDYPFISRIADRVIVMAYDEHHKSSEPGPIASLPWCRKIHDYAMETIAPEKLVMGIPLYGRGWQLEKTGRSFRNREVWTNIRETNARPESSAAEGGSYSYTTPVTVRVYFETMPSLKAKMDLYSSRPIRGIAFWRIGQEPLNFWDML
jgi:spore germination protein YaaH